MLLHEVSNNEKEPYKEFIYEPYDDFEGFDRRKIRRKDITIVARSEADAWKKYEEITGDHAHAYVTLKKG